MRLIDADKIEFTANGCGHPNCKDICEYTKDSGECCGWLVAHKREVDKMQTIDAVPVVHGHWKGKRKYEVGAAVDDDGWLELEELCSVCGKWVKTQWRSPLYCPKCGAKMDGERRDDG